MKTSLRYCLTAVTTASAFSCAHAPDPSSLLECQGPRSNIRFALDADATSINLTPESSSIESLSAMDPPRIADHAPRLPIERRTFGITGWLVHVRGPLDGPVTLVLKGDSGALMLARLPAGVCLTGSPIADSVATARDTLRYMTDPSTSGDGRVRVRVNGVVHFAEVRGDGDAPNGVELDPVLTVETR